MAKTISSSPQEKERTGRSRKVAPTSSPPPRRTHERWQTTVRRTTGDRKVRGPQCVGVFKASSSGVSSAADRRAGSAPRCQRHGPADDAPRMAGKPPAIPAKRDFVTVATERDALVGPGIRCAVRIHPAPISRDDGRPTVRMTVFMAG